MVARAAGEQQHLAACGRRPPRPRRRRDWAAATARSTTISSVLRDRARLLEDLLLHVVRVRPELDRRPATARLHRRAPVDEPALAVADAHAARAAPRRSSPSRGRSRRRVLLMQRARVGGEKVLALTQPDEQRRALARAHDRRRAPGSRRSPTAYAPSHSRLAAWTASNSVEPFAGTSECTWCTITSVSVSERKRIAERLHPRADRLVVLDDAVVDDADLEPAARREMRVRVRLARRAVRRPARVGEPGAGLGPACLRASSSRCATRPVERSRSRWPSLTNAIPAES